jgi:chemotaxis protein MotB
MNGRRIRRMALAMAALTVLTGCVSKGTHTQTLSELEDAQKSLVQTSAAFETSKKDAAAEIENLKQLNNVAANERLAAQTQVGRLQQQLDKANQNLSDQLEAGRTLEAEAKRLREDVQQTARLSGELRRERDLLDNKAQNLQRRLETAEQDLAAGRKAIETADAQMLAQQKEQEALRAALTDRQNEARDLATRLQVEQAQTASLRDEKQKLLSGTTTAQDEIARLQKLAGELQTQAARVKDLEARLSERDQELGRLQHLSADRDTLAVKATALAAEGEGNKQRITVLTGELATLGSEAARMRQERDQLRDDFQRLKADYDLQHERLKAEAAEKARLERERQAKEEEIRRLTGVHADLTKSLQAEIAKGDIKIQQMRDRLTINMVDRVLFDSGQAQVKTAGLKVLKQVSDILRNVADKQIRIEGHTDNVPIGVKLKERFPTNWELSTARATSVVRYLIEEGGVNRTALSAMGYADTRPVAGNETEEGKAANRRIEIVLYPKELELAAQSMP